MSRSLNWNFALIVVCCSVVLQPRHASGQTDESTETTIPIAASTDEPVVAVVVFAGVDAIWRDLEMVGKLGDVPGIKSMLEGLVSVQTGGKGLAGIDPTRPWGIVLRGQEARPLFVIPCTDLGDLVETLAIISGGKLKNMGDGTFRMRVQGKSFFLRQEGDLAYAAPTRSELASVPHNVMQLFDGLHDQYDVAAKLNWQQIPTEIRELALLASRRNFKRSITWSSDETREDFNARRDAEAAKFEEVLASVQQTDTITCGWRLDEKSQQAVLDVTWQAVAGSEAAQFTDYLYTEPSRFAGFIDPAATMTLNISTNPLSDQGLQCVSAALDQITQRAIDGDTSATTAEEVQVLRDGFNEMAETVLATLGEEGADLAMSLYAINGEITMVMALEITDEERLERAMQQLSTLDDPPQIQWNYTTIGDIRCHKTINTDQVRSSKSQPESGLLGFGEKAFYLAMGNNAEKALQRALASSKSASANELPPIQLSLSISDAIQNAPSAEPFAALQQIWSQFPTQDHLNVSVRPVEHGVRLRVELERGVIAALSKSIGMGVNESLTSANKRK